MELTRALDRLGLGAPKRVALDWTSWMSVTDARHCDRFFAQTDKQLF